MPAPHFVDQAIPHFTYFTRYCVQVANMDRTAPFVRPYARAIAPARTPVATSWPLEGSRILDRRIEVLNFAQGEKSAVYPHYPRNRTARQCLTLLRIGSTSGRKQNLFQPGSVSPGTENTISVSCDISIVLQTTVRSPCVSNSRSNQY